MKNKALLVVLVIILMICNLLIGITGGYLGATKFDFARSDKSISSNTETEKNVEYNIPRNDNIFIDVVEKTQGGVVSIIVSKDLPIYEDYYTNPYGGNGDIFDYFFGRRQRRQIGEEERQIGAGTGFIVSEDGYIVTNRHVVSDTKASYTVILNDDEKVEAEILARDTFLDIAILKINKTGLNFVEMGDSDEIKVGQQVLAIGNALGEFSNTVSSGIVSGLSRSVTAGSGFGDYETLSGVVQTDASINPGNSGGPLLDLEGRAIGVNVAVAANAENIGFAIPINSIKSIVESVKENGKIIRPFLGVRYIPISSQIKEKNNLSVDYGIIILRGEEQGDLAVIPGSPADKAGLRENDIILEIDGTKLDENTSLQKEIQKHEVGDEVKLKVLTGGEEKDVTVKLEASE